MGGRLRILHAIHDFLPRHAAGSEIYAFNLCRELSARHVVHVVAAEYDLARPHGSLTWRVHDGVPVVELVNNWQSATFEETWRSPRLGEQLAHVLRATQPDILHVHSLLNLSLELPAIARQQGIPVVATLHDHTLVCPAGGQRLHVIDGTVCATIDPARCAACFGRSPFQAQRSVAAIDRLGGPARRLVPALVRTARRLVPGLAASLGRSAAARRIAPVSVDDVRARLDSLRSVYEAVDVFVAPSEAVAREHRQLGMPPGKLIVSDYGFMPRHRERRRGRRADGDRVRLGFVGTLVRHKGVHLLVEAARLLPADRFEIEIHGSLDTFPDYTARLARAAEGLPIAFCGPFPPSSADAVFDRFDLLVVPSVWPENSPLVIHEAFMAGVPVAGADIGGIPELVSPGVSGVLFQPDSAAALAAALRPLLEDPSRLSALSAGVPPVKSIAEDAREWEGRYEAVIAGGRP